MKSLMVGGTASGVGKSWMTAAICAWLHRRGVRVAPFKAQNMSNNSYPCADGGEIGRAQVAQAEACGLEPTVDMNPILLKPTGEAGSQVVVQGRVWRNLTAREYYEHYEFLSSKVDESFERLASKYDFVVMEGAGSVAELNLRRTDLVNLGLAQKFGAPVLLVGDIDRGGIFGSIFGTLAVLPGDEATLVRAFAVNRFRGDPTLFTNGVTILEEKTGKPCLGVFPCATDVHLDEEDGMSTDRWKPRPEGAPSIAILAFPRISNVTDFRLFPWASWIERPPARSFDIVMLPGTKNTIADLEWMKAQGLDAWVREQHANGARIVGICGGYQMLGASVEDPHQVESSLGCSEGLGLLPVSTVLQSNKVTERVTAVSPRGESFSAYEIHMGDTKLPPDAVSFAHVNGKPEGLCANGCIGTYLHGAMEHPGVVEEWLGYRPAPVPTKQRSYEQLAEWFEASADIALFEKLFL